MCLVFVSLRSLEHEYSLWIWNCICVLAYVPYAWALMWVRVFVYKNVFTCTENCLWTNVLYKMGLKSAFIHPLNAAAGTIRPPKIISFVFLVPPPPFLLCWCLIVAGIMGMRREEGRDYRKNTTVIMVKLKSAVAFRPLPLSGLLHVFFSLSPVLCPFLYGVQELWNHYVRSCK